jgi:predicted NodU family carbamoyl transferase
MDGGGDHGDHRHIVGGSYDKTKRETPFQEFLSLPGSIGIANLHAWITESIGLSDDGKMAGLAGYGKVDTELYRQLSQLLVWDSANYAFQFTRQRFKPSKYRLDRLNIENYERKKIIQNQPGFTNVFEICRRFAPQDVAATGSKLVQDALIPTLKKLKEISTLDCLTVVGGLFNNVSINRVILESGIFREVHFSMSPGDAGLGLGAAMWARRTKDTSWTEQTPKRRALSPFVGPCFSSDEIAKILKDTRTPHKKLSRDKMAAKAAQVIADGGIVGVFVDRAEYGPRSLGHRSILGDPRKIDTKQKINLYLKKRDWFMPYAPAILEEFASEWIPNSAPSPYMQIAFKVRPNYEKIIPSAIHVDGSARFQIVSAEHSEFFHSIISSFHKLTGVPIVLNTSFNRHGIATISTPRQALQHLLECSCEYLILGDYWLDLNEIRKLSPIHIVIEDESLLLKKFESSYREKLQQIES